MDFKELKQHLKELMTAMGRNGLKRLVIKHDDVEVELEREVSTQTFAPMVPETSLTLGQGQNNRTLPSAMAPEHPEAVSQQESNDQVVTSPMVGTFYAAAAPEALPFAKVGDVVTKDTVVCIIEAMKVMNEIKAGIAGTLTEVLVASGDPVEFGTKLFRVR